MNVDQIYVLTLKDNVERQKTFKSNNPDMPFKFVHGLEAKDRTQLPRIIADNHINIMTKGPKNKIIAIFEDDAVPLYNYKTTCTLINKALKELPDTWQYLSLGYIPIRLELTNDTFSTIRRVRCIYDAHAYLINLKNVNLKKLNHNSQIDFQLFCHNLSPEEIYHQLPGSIGFMEETYAIKPMLYKQATLNSSRVDIDDHQYFYQFFKIKDSDVIISEHINILYFGIWVFGILGMLIIFGILSACLGPICTYIGIGFILLWTLVWGIIFALD